ncbi:MAG: carbonic anhydrase [Oscillospiraceae bacterium]|nr:carbonic anhydrase [Oscillospiraceae bacterium]
MNHPLNISAAEAIQRLKQGNLRYVQGEATIGDVSPAARQYAWRHGQAPYAIVITCSDSRVIPESIFSSGIGELFVIRLAGNVIDNHQLGSIEYAAGHLGSRLIVVLGHTCCGAVDAAIYHDPDGYVKFITDEIKKAVGDAKDDYTACCLNARHSAAMIEQSLDIQSVEAEIGLQVAVAIYHVESGQVEFLDAASPPPQLPEGDGASGSHV